MFKGLLTKSGYITKVKKITRSCTQTTVILFLTLQKWKQMKCNQDILVQTLTEIMIAAAKPMEAHIIDQSLNEFIVMSYYLLPPVNHQLTDLFSFHNYNDWLWLANQKPNTNNITSQVECLESKNSKSFCQKLHTCDCEYFSFHTIYELET